MASTLPGSKTHRTAVFVRVAPGDSADYIERRKALVVSFDRQPNIADGDPLKTGATIKTNVFTVQGDQITRGLNDAVAGTPALDPAVRAAAEAAGYELVARNVVEAPSGNISDEDLKALAGARGYVQTFVVSDPR